MRTVHYVNGCAWASGDLQSADTDQTDDLSKVTCKHCLRQVNLLIEHFGVSKDEAIKWFEETRKADE